MTTMNTTHVKRLNEIRTARRVHNVGPTMYRAMHNRINDDGGGLTVGSAHSRQSAHRRLKVGRTQTTNATRLARLAPR